MRFGTYNIEWMNGLFDALEVQLDDKPSARENTSRQEQAEAIAHQTLLLDMPNSDCYVFCEDGGLLELCVELGQTVSAGQRIARVHDIRRTGVAPHEYRAKIDGLLAGRHFPGLIQSGDCLAVVACLTPSRDIDDAAGRVGSRIG